MNISTFNSFKSRNFRLYFIGQSMSLIGTWMQKTAVSWVIYTITKSEFMLGVSVFATLFPTAVFSLFGGIISDRYNRYKVLLLTQVLSLVQAILLAVAIAFFTNYIVWTIIILSVVLGVINSFDVPARQSLVREMINDHTDLPNALALNSSMVNLSKLIGPTLAGFILERFGDQMCFAINAVSFIPVIICLLMMRLPEYVKEAVQEKNIRRELSEAVKYLQSNTTMSSVIIFAALVNFLVIPFTTLTPVFAKDIFQGSASTLGVIDGIIGFGALIGAIFLASLKAGTNLSKVLAVNTMIFGIGLLFFSHSSNFRLALLFLAVSGFGMMSVMTISNTIVQVNVPNRFKGRVISIFIMSRTAALPLGSLLVGAISHYAGVKATVLVEGVIAVIIAWLYNRYLKKKKLKKRAIPILQNTPVLGVR